MSVRVRPPESSQSSHVRSARRDETPCRKKSRIGPTALKCRESRATLSLSLSLDARVSVDLKRTEAEKTHNRGGKETEKSTPHRLRAARLRSCRRRPRSPESCV